MTETTPDSELRAGPDAGGPATAAPDDAKASADVAQNGLTDAGAADAPDAPGAAGNASEKPGTAAERPVEYGGPSGPEPTRYGDWERKGRCVDF